MEKIVLRGIGSGNLAVKFYASPSVSIPAGSRWVIDQVETVTPCVPAGTQIGWYVEDKDPFRRIEGNIEGDGASSMLIARDVFECAKDVRRDLTFTLLFREKHPLGEWRLTLERMP